jgi:membrane complex biogenesis BtpA family protein
MKSLFITIAILVATAHAQAGTRLQSIFKNPKPIIAVINLPALPGQKGFTTIDNAVQAALQELAILEAEGVDGAILENNQGDFAATPEITAAMTRIVSEVVKASKTVVVGCEVLWHDPKASFAIAKATGAKFIRTDFFVDKVIADGTVVDPNAKEMIDYRKSIDADDVVILTDIQVKYTVMVDPKKTITQSAQEAEAANSDGVVVTGAKSGMPPSLAKVTEAKNAVKNVEIVLGSGTSSTNIEELLAVADATIVGTSISTGTGGTLVQSKVHDYMEVVKKIRKNLP